MKEKKITETITLYRLNFSLIVIAIFGITNTQQPLFRSTAIILLVCIRYFLLR